MIGLKAQIQEVQREIAMRERFYPRQVLAGKMRQHDADEHLARMRAVLDTLLQIAIEQHLEASQ